MSAFVPRGSRRGLFSVASGHAWSLNQDFGGDRVSMRMVEEQIGGNFRGDDGVGMSAVMQQRFTDDYGLFVFGARLRYDVAPSEDFGVYISPMITAGYTFASGRSDTGHGANAQFTVEARFLFVDRLTVHLRPVSLDALFMSPIVLLSWSMTLGLGVTF